MTLRIREARPADAPAIARLSEQLGYSVEPEFVTQKLRDLLSRKDHAVFVADQAGRIVGWVHVHERVFLYVPPFAEIGGIVVDEAHRGEGIGKRLMERCEQWAKKAGYGEIRLRSGGTRKKAHAFYRGIGYENIKWQEVFRRTW
jgi:GNAT superfamily N-acetyltransferase